MREGILVWEAEQVVSTGFPLQPSCSELPFEPRLSSKSNLPSPQGAPWKIVLILLLIVIPIFFIPIVIVAITWWSNLVNCGSFNHRPPSSLVCLTLDSFVISQRIDLDFESILRIFPRLASRHTQMISHMSYILETRNHAGIGWSIWVTCHTCKKRWWERALDKCLQVFYVTYLRITH